MASPPPAVHFPLNRELQRIDAVWRSVREGTPVLPRDSTIMSPSQSVSSVSSSRLSFRLHNDPELIAPLVTMLQEELGDTGVCDDNTRDRVGVALQEALSNAMFHGNLEVSSELRQDDESLFYAEVNKRRRMAPYRNRIIQVFAEVDRDAAKYCIRDEGPGFDTTTLDLPFDPESLTRVGGRGMILIRTFMDEVKHNKTGNEVVMVKRRK